MAWLLLHAAWWYIGGIRQAVARKIQVTGHHWWWRVRHPREHDAPIELANERLRDSGYETVNTL